MKKLVFEERFFKKSLELLQTTDKRNVKVAVLNYIINLAWRDNDSANEKIRNSLKDMNVIEILSKMKAAETNSETKVYYTRAINKLS